MIPMCQEDVQRLAQPADQPLWKFNFVSHHSTSILVCIDAGFLSGFSRSPIDILQECNVLGRHFDNLFTGLPVTGLEVPVHGNLGPGLEEGEGQFSQGSPNDHAQAFQVLFIGEDEPQGRHNYLPRWHA